VSVDLTAGIVRILTSDGGTAGTGFVVTDEGLIATCAHVVEGAGAGAGQSVLLAFHATAEEREARVGPEWWRAPNAEDVAILRLEGPLPEGVVPLLLGSSGGTSGHPFKTFGFPAARSVEGMWGYGTVGDPVPDFTDRDLIQLTSATEISAGFSGAPVSDTTTRRVVGMVIAITAPDEYGRLTQTTFIISTETLRAVCAELQLSDICPYQGLAAFTEADAEFFFGREALVADLVNHLRGNPRFLAVVGPSGSGKSSVVQSGLLPALLLGEVPGSEDWHLLPFRPGTDLFAALTDAGLDVPRESKLQAAVCTFLEAHPQVKRLLLFADQFEELFALCSESMQERFLNQLLALLEGDLRVTVIIALRADFYGHLLCHQPLADWLKMGQVNVPPMGPAKLRAAVEEPALRLGLRFEPRLVETIVEETSKTEHPLPLLESALTQLWKNREDGMLTHAAYQAVGRVAGAIGQWAEDTYSGLTREEQAIARRIFTKLVHYGEGEAANTRQQRSLVDLTTRPEEQATLHQLVGRLAGARLLVTGGDPGAETVEIIHDALLQQWGRLRHWTIEQQEFYLWRQRLDERLQEWDEKERDKDTLLRGVLLTEAERWLAERPDDLNRDERKYIYKSIALRERLRRRMILGLAVGLVVTLALLLLAGVGWRRADSQAQIALSRQLAAQALAHLEDQLDLALLLSVEAYQAANTFEARSSLLTGLEYSPYLASFLRGHTDSVNSVAFSPDGQTLASGSDDNTVILWDVAIRQPLGQPLVGHTDSVSSVAFSPDGRLLASGSADNTIRLWDVATGQSAGQPLTGPTGKVTSVIFSPDGRILASSSCGRLALWGAVCEAGEIRLWDVATRQPLGPPLVGHELAVNSIAFSPDGKTLASSGCATYSGARYVCDRGEIRLWDVTTRQPLGQPITDHTDSVQSVTFSPDGNLLASGSVDGIILWNVLTHQPINRSLTDRICGVNSVAFSPDGGILASGSGNPFLCRERHGHITVWDVATGQPIDQPFTGYAAVMSSVAFGPDGKTLASGSNDGTIILWDITTHQRLGQPLTKYTGSIYSVAFSPDGGILALANEENSVILWDVVTRRPLGQSQPLTDLRSVWDHMTFSPDGKMLASVAGDSVVLLDVATCQSLNRFHISDRYPCAAFSPDGKTLASRERETVILWDVATGQPIGQPLTGHADTVHNVAFSPDGKTLASGSTDGIILWDVATRQPIGQPLTGQNRSMNSVAFSPDGKALAAARANGIILWDVATRQPIGQFSSRFTMSNLVFSPDGKTLASSRCREGIFNICIQGEIILWDVATHQPLAQPFTGHLGPVSSVAFSPDGKTLASSSNQVEVIEGEDNTIILWDIDLESWQARACSIAKRNLTPEEWRQYIGEGAPYRPTCPNLPVPEE
jgi:WD40 repeat protein